MIASPLEDALRRAAAAPVLVVASDYDGTLAEIVTDPERATPDGRALAALAALGTRPGVHGAIVSGRARAVLARLTGAPAGIALIGSHGAEATDAATPAAVPGLLDDLRVVADRYPGTLLEPKPAGGALHYRSAAAPHEAAEAAREVGRRHGVRVIDGKQVVELVAGDADKGTALDRARRAAGGGPLVFFGDDVTDEDVFATLGDGDVGVKVGDGETLAAYRVAGPQDVADALELLLAARGT